MLFKIKDLKIKTMFLLGGICFVLQRFDHVRAYCTDEKGFYFSLPFECEVEVVLKTK